MTEQYLTLTKALIKCLEGERVRHKSWPKDAYIHFEDGWFQDDSGFTFSSIDYDTGELDYGWVICVKKGEK